MRLLAFVAGMMAVYTGVYMITPWPVETLLSCTRYRLLAHLAPLTLLLVAMVADELGRDGQGGKGEGASGKR